MRVADAPPAGWYPDPAGESRLRWWDGLDWTDHHRALATRGSAEDRASVTPDPQAADGMDAAALAAQSAAQARRETETIISQVREIARSEIDRAGEMFSQRAEAATRRIQPLITEYSSKVVRLVRIVGALAAVILVAWFVFQVILQASVFDWLGDRIDNISND